MPEQKRLSLAGIGCGSRTRTYMKLAMEQKNRYRIAAAADPVKQRTEAVRDFAPEEERDSVRLFKDAASLLAEPRLADVAIIGTQDDSITLRAGRPWSWAIMSCWKSPSPRR